MRQASRAVRPPPDLSLLDWSRRFLPSLLTAPPSPFHHWLCDELDALRTRRDQRLCALAPRGAAKSTWASLAYPLREVLEGREAFVLITSDTGDQARAFLRQIKAQVEGNEAILAAYGDQRGALWRDDHVRLKGGCEVLALGTGGKVRGRKSTANRRPTLIISDDPQNKDHIVSALKRERSWEWLTKDLLSAGEPGTNFVVLGTALHREAIVCRLPASGWRSRTWKAVTAWPARMDLWAEWEAILHDYGMDDGEREQAARAFYECRRDEMDREAEVLWPEREPLYGLMVLRATIGLSAFASEKMNDPVDPALCELAEYLDWPGIWFDEWPEPKDVQVKTIALDPSKGRADRPGDYSAIVRYCRTTHGVEYVEADLARRPVNVMCHDLVAHQQAFVAHGVAVESDAWQDLLAAPIEQAARAACIEVPVYMQPTGGVPKIVRVRQLDAPLAQRRMRFKRRSPGTALLVQQLRDWPHGGHDDGPDALQAARKLAIALLDKKARPSQPTRVRA